MKCLHNETNLSVPCSLGAFTVKVYVSNCKDIERIYILLDFTGNITFSLIREDFLLFIIK